MVIPQLLSSNQLNRDQELKRQILPELMKKHWKEIDLSESANETKDVWIHLFEKYQCQFN